MKKIKPFWMYPLFTAALLAVVSASPAYAVSCDAKGGQKLHDDELKLTETIEEAEARQFVKEAEEIHPTSYGGARNADEAAVEAKKRVQKQERDADFGLNAKDPKARAQRESLQHQDDLIEGLNDDIAKALEAEGFDINAFYRGVVDSDMGKLAKYRALLTDESKKSDLLLSVLAGRGPKKSTEALRELLDQLGFKDKWLLNPNMTPAQLRQMFKDVPMLTGFLHELPGMADAIILFEKGVISKQQFMKQMAANLFHNGPQAGFWDFFTTQLVPGKFGLSNGKNPLAANFFEGTVFEGARNADGVIVPVYPSPKSFEGATHSFLDRMSQGTRGGVKKIFYEVHGTTPNKIGQMGDLMFGSNPKGTMAQLDKLGDDAKLIADMSPGAQKKFQDLVGAGKQRLEKYNAWIKEHVHAELGPDGRAISMTYTYPGNKKITFKPTSDGGVEILVNGKRVASYKSQADQRFIDKLAEYTDNLLKAEEKANGNAVTGLKIGEGVGSKAGASGATAADIPMTVKDVGRVRSGDKIRVSGAGDEIVTGEVVAVRKKSGQVDSVDVKLPDNTIVTIPAKDASKKLRKPSPDAMAKEIEGTLGIKLTRQQVKDDPDLLARLYNSAQVRKKIDAANVDETVKKHWRERHRKAVNEHYNACR